VVQVWSLSWHLFFPDLRLPGLVPLTFESFEREWGLSWNSMNTRTLAAVPASEFTTRTL